MKQVSLDDASERKFAGGVQDRISAPAMEVFPVGLIGTDHEAATIKAFVVPEKRARFLGFVTNPKRRRKFINELAHFPHLDPRYVVPIVSRDQNPRAILALLRAKGAGDKCWVISDWEMLDGKELSLESALHEIVGAGMGTIVPCIAGKHAYFEDEDGRCILER